MHKISHYLSARAMRKSIFVITILLCACSCSNEQASYTIPEIPEGDRYSSIEEQLRTSHARAEQDSNNAVAIGQFAMVLQAYGMYPQAESVYGRARQLAPGDFRWAYLHGFVLDVLGEDIPAREAYAAAADINPAEGSTAAGAVLLKLGDMEAAREKLLEALTYNERNARALYELGRLEKTEGNLELAKDYLLRSLAAGANHPSIFYVLAEIAKRHGDEALAAKYRERFKAAEERGHRWPDRWLAEVRKARSNSDRDLMDAAVRAIQTGNITAAIKFNEQARTINPDNPLTAAALIGLYAIDGDNERSEQALAIARELDPDSAQFHYNVGLARIAQKRYAEAIDALQRVTEIDPQGSMAWVKLGDTYIAQRDRDLAIEAFSEALERTPSDQELRLKLGVLQVETKKYEAGLATLAGPATEARYEARRLWAVGRAHRHLGSIEQAVEALSGARSAATRAGELRLASTIAAELERLDAPIAD